VLPRRLLLCLVALPSACAHSSPAATDASSACRRLVESEPKDFADAMACVLDLGPTAAVPLATALRERPHGTGVEAALATLGALGGDDAVETLVSFVADRHPEAAAAALALGDCHQERTRMPLLEAAMDRLADPRLRAAACASLLRLGERQNVRLLVRGILLAGTPAGHDLEADLGLPQRPRWAYERYLLQRALRSVAGQDFGLDTDAPWQRLAECAERVDTWLESQR
jgi:hypothetical protein